MENKGYFREDHVNESTIKDKRSSATFYADWAPHEKVA